MRLEKRPELKLGEPPTAEEKERLIEKAMLETVLQAAGGDESKIREGIIKALNKVDDPARRTYLWNTLQRKASERIRRQQHKAAA